MFLLVPTRDQTIATAAAPTGAACNLFWLPAQPLVLLVGGGVGEIVCVLPIILVWLTLRGICLVVLMGILFHHGYTHAVVATLRLVKVLQFLEKSWKFLFFFVSHYASYIYSSTVGE